MKKVKYKQPLPTMYRANGIVELYNINASYQLLDYYNYYNIGILGFEGFIKFENKYIPDINWIADFSQLYISEPENFVEKSIQVSRDILEKAPKNILFEFVPLKSD